LRNVPSWVIGKGPGDPFETYGTPSEPTKADDFAADLFVDAGDTQPPGLSAALLNFTPPTGAFQASLDTIVGGGAGTLGIGFTTSTTTLFDNFQQFGQASLTLTGLGAGRGGVATWTLRTDGISGPSLSGTFVMQDWLPMALSYDPLTHTVQGSVDGVLTGALDYTATGITGVGFEGIGHVDNFLVQTGALSGAVGVVPEPAGWAMMIAGFGGVGALARGRRRRTAALTVASDPRAA
jgi:hypothetical protein